MNRFGLALALGLGFTAVAAPAFAQPPRELLPAPPRSQMGPPGKPVNGVDGTIFKCEGGRELRVRFTSAGEIFQAIVYSGDQVHTLPSRPWTSLEPKVTWSDGPHTLTWSPGVVLMWMDGGNHLMCGHLNEEIADHSGHR